MGGKHTNFFMSNQAALQPYKKEAFLQVTPLFLAFLFAQAIIYFRNWPSVLINSCACFKVKSVISAPASMRATSSTL